MTVGRHVDLKAWQSAMMLVAEVYRLSLEPPSSERYGLVRQMRRAAISVTSNISEGHARRSKREYLRFVVVATGSLAELESQLLVVERLDLVVHGRLTRAMMLVDRTGRLLRGLEHALAAKVLHRERG